MAKNIPMDEALTDESRRYLRDRGAWGAALEKRLDANYLPDPAALAAFNAREKADSVTAPGDIQLREENARLLEQIAQLQAAAATESDDDEDDEDDEDEDDLDYSEMSMDELKAEVDRRNTAGATLSKSGTKVELIARLEADDAAG